MGNWSADYLLFSLLWFIKKWWQEHKTSCMYESQSAIKTYLSMFMYSRVNRYININTPYKLHCSWLVIIGKAQVSSSPHGFICAFPLLTCQSACVLERLWLHLVDTIICFCLSVFLINFHTHQSIQLVAICILYLSPQIYIYIDR